MRALALQCVENLFYAVSQNDGQMKVDARPQANSRSQMNAELRCIACIARAVIIDQSGLCQIADMHLSGIHAYMLT